MPSFVINRLIQELFKSTFKIRRHSLTANPEVDLIHSNPTAMVAMIKEAANPEDSITTTEDLEELEGTITIIPATTIVTRVLDVVTTTTDVRIKRRRHQPTTRLLLQGKNTQTKASD